MLPCRVHSVSNNGVRLTYEALPDKVAPDLLKAIRSHYPGSRFAGLGRVLAFRIEEDGRRIGHLMLGEPALNLTARARIGAGPRFLPGTVTVSLFRILDRRKSEASTILRLWHDFAALCWWRKYGERIKHWETFVNPDKVRNKQNPGACFKRAGYRSLGRTKGYSPCECEPGEQGYKRGSVKLILYRGPLARIPVRELPTEARKLCEASP